MGQARGCLPDPGVGESLCPARSRAACGSGRRLAATAVSAASMESRGDEQRGEEKGRYMLAQVGGGLYKLWKAWQAGLHSRLFRKQNERYFDRRGLICKSMNYDHLSLITTD